MQCNEYLVFNQGLWGRVTTRWQSQLEICVSVCRGGLRPQLGPGVVAQRGPKMPQKASMWRITRHAMIRHIGDF